MATREVALRFASGNDSWVDKIHQQKNNKICVNLEEDGKENGIDDGEAKCKKGWVDVPGTNITVPLKSEY